jgi:hypothetical protein
LNSFTVTFGGSAPTAAAFLDNVTLRDSNGAVTLSSNSTSTACSGTGTCTKGFVFGTGTGGYQISAGTSKTFTLRIDSTKTASAQANITQNLFANIQAGTDVVFTDGLDGGATSGITLPTTGQDAPPISINSVSFPTGL